MVEKPNPEEAGNYIADIINKNRESGETNNQVLVRLISELIKDSTDWYLIAKDTPVFYFLQATIDYHKELMNKFDVKDLYKK